MKPTPLSHRPVAAPAAPLAYEAALRAAALAADTIDTEAPGAMAAAPGPTPALRMPTSLGAAQPPQLPGLPLADAVAATLQLRDAVDQARAEATAGTDPAQLAALQAAYDLACAQLDAHKAAGLAALGGGHDGHGAARKLAVDVEVMHGKAGQAQRAVQVARHLLTLPEVAQRFAPEASQAVLDAIPLLNLGDAQGSTAAYLAAGRPTADALALFAGRPQRAYALLTQHQLLTPAARDVVRDFHANAPSSRPLAAQLLDLSERLSAMTQDRPQRPAMPAARVADILTGVAAAGVLDADLVAVACAQLIAGKLAGAQHSEEG